MLGTPELADEDEMAKVPPLPVFGPYARDSPARSTVLLQGRCSFSGTVEAVPVTSSRKPPFTAGSFKRCLCSGVGGQWGTQNDD